MIPKIAVLLAAYNGMIWLPEQVKSILAQEDVSVTLFISVDKSTDGTELWVQDLASQDRHVNLLPYGAKFGSAAPNFYRLLRDVDFDEFNFIAFSDQDDIWLPRKLACGIECIKEKNCDGYSSNVIAIWADGKQRIVKKAQKQKEFDFLFEGAGPGCSCIISKKLAIKIKDMIKAKWKELHKIDWHDWLIYAYARANGYSWYIDPVPYMLYRQHQNNQIGTNMGLKAILSRARRIISGYGLDQAKKIAEVVGAYSESRVSELLERSYRGLLKILINSGKCRRKRRDVIVLALACILMLVARTPSKKQN